MITIVIILTTPKPPSDKPLAHASAFFGKSQRQIREEKWNRRASNYKGSSNKCDSRNGNSSSRSGNIGSSVFRTIT